MSAVDGAAGRRFDAAPSTDPRNRDFPTSAVIGPQPDVRKIWRAGAVLDQGSDPACTAFCWVGDLMAAPQGDFKATSKQGNDLGRRMNLDTFKMQHEGLGNAINLGAEWSKRRGYITEYRWPQSLEDFRDAIVGGGPVAIGIDWFPSMNYPRKDDTILFKDTTTMPSNHAVLVHGYDPEVEFKGYKKPRPGFLIRNSWGRWWGKDGSAWLPASDLDKIIRRKSYGWPGQACYAHGRKPFSVAAALATYDT